MIQSVEIQGLRGIREGKVTDLSPLVVLVGPNGCGKSTILEAILIGASRDCDSAIVEVIHRHETDGSGPQWLLWRAGESGPTKVTVKTSAREAGTCELRLARSPTGNKNQISFKVFHNAKEVGVGHVVGIKKGSSSREYLGDPLFLTDVAEVNLVEAYSTDSQTPLPDLYTKTVKQERRNEAVEFISAVFPGIKNLEILTENGIPILHLVFEDGHRIPASLAGDGIKSLLRLSLELAASSGGVALLEEPEVHQHPGAIRQSARAIVKAVRRGIQVVLTTHSLEMIDALVGESSDEDLKQLSLYLLKLQDGLLTTAHLDGADVAFARTTIEDDLR